MSGAGESAYEPGQILAAVRKHVVGMERVAEVLAVALATGRHLVLEGPPGTGKSTLLRTIAAAARTELRFVEGNAELTPGRLVGHFDPALVLEGGYRPDAFVPGPLADALQHGHVLYLEELNRVPEESLNVLITALAEGELHVPRFGRIPAAPGFRLIAAMNPYDAIGTARIGQAIYDRLCRVAVGYQDADHEQQIVERVTGASRRSMDVDVGVGIVRRSREHADIRVGASVRGAIDFALLAKGLRELRQGDVATAAVKQHASLLDAALAALSGRIRLDEACDRTPEDVVAELLDDALSDWLRRMGNKPDPVAEDPNPGKGESPAPSPPGDRGRGRILTGEEARNAVEEAARRTTGRNELTHRHGERFEQASPEVGHLDDAFVEELAGASPDEALALLADLANATDVKLRAAARQLAARIFVRLAKQAATPKRGVRHLRPDSDLLAGDLDLDLSLARSDGRRPTGEHELVVRRWTASERAICLLVDRSGSMNGAAVARAALAAASTVVAAGERSDCSVVTFARDAIVLQAQGKRRSADAVLNDILTLRGRGETDLGLALRAARRQLATAGARDRVVVLLSDAKATTGDDPVVALRGIDRLHVLCPTDDDESVAKARLLARRAGGRCAIATSVRDIPSAITALLADD